MDVVRNDRALARRPGEEIPACNRRPRIVVACTPMRLHRRGAELVVLGVGLEILRGVDQMDDVHDLAATLLRKARDLGLNANRGWELIDRALDEVAQFLSPHEAVRAFARAARGLDVLLG